MNAFDQTLFLWLNLGAAASSWLIDGAQAASQKLPHWMVAAFVTVGLAGRADWRRQAWRALAAMVLALLAVALLKQGFNHPRPIMLGLGTQWLDHRMSSGFPSAHSAAAMALALSAMRAPMRWPARLLILAAGLAVGWSRPALGLHFPSDVLAGWGVAALCVFAVERASSLATLWPGRLRG